MDQENKSHHVELPENAQRIVHETVANVRAKERGFVVDKPKISGKGFMIITIFSLSALLTHLTHGFYEKDKKLFSDQGQLVFSSDSLSELDMVMMNRLKLEKSLKHMKEAVEQRTALNKIQAHLMARRQGNDALGDGEARDLLLRAGYMPAEIDDEKIEKVKKRHQALYENRDAPAIDRDVDFAKHVANDIVQDEIESFAHKIRLISVVGGYLFSRVNEEAAE